MAKKQEEEVKIEKPVKEMEFFLEYIRNTRRTWNDQDLRRNQEHAFLGITSEIGELSDAYKKVIGYGKKLDTTNVLEEIGDVSYFTARLLDELFYKHEEPFTRVESKTVFDEILETIGAIIKGNAKADVTDIEPLDMVLALPCYIKDIYTGAVAKNPDTFALGVLSLIANLHDLSEKLGTSYVAVLKANIKKLKNRFPEKFDSVKEANRDKKKEAKTIKDATK